MAPSSLPGTTDRRLASLLTLLANNATIAISGQRVAKEIGVTRSTVWRWVERLRGVGVRVKGKPNTGYFLERVPENIRYLACLSRARRLPVAVRPSARRSNVSRRFLLRRAAH